VQNVGGTPFENLIVAFTELPWARGCEHLLVFVCTFPGWVEDFPTQTKKAWEVSICLLKQIIPHLGIPVSIGLDNGLVFVAEIVQLEAKGLGIS
jgi:hypothetical protein